MWSVAAALRSLIHHSRVRSLSALRKSKQEINHERIKEMTKQNTWVASLATPVMIAMLLLFAGSPSVKASNNDKASAANAAVKIDNFVFGPQTLKVPVGTTVTWTNNDDIPHTSVSTEGAWKSKVLDTDEKFSY